MGCANNQVTAARVRVAVRERGSTLGHAQVHSGQGGATGTELMHNSACNTAIVAKALLVPRYVSADCTRYHPFNKVSSAMHVCSCPHDELTFEGRLGGFLTVLAAPAIRHLWLSTLSTSLQSLVIPLSDHTSTLPVKRITLCLHHDSIHIMDCSKTPHSCYRSHTRQHTSTHCRNAPEPCLRVHA